jgi:hypothetical protein
MSSLEDFLRTLPNENTAGSFPSRPGDSSGPRAIKQTLEETIASSNHHTRNHAIQNYTTTNSNSQPDGLTSPLSTFMKMWNENSNGDTGSPAYDDYHTYDSDQQRRFKS